ncbi:MAG TPA: pseudouridine synthase [Candidatus Saccharimonadales bacterium]|nr:pseudouridine synthase [Candidatus Saccharimonadales bacterium]
MIDNDNFRLNKFLAHKLGLSRREADDMIAAGRITLDGEVAQLGARLRGGQSVKLDDKAIDLDKPAYTYLAFNKPVGYVCSRRSQGETPTIYKLLPDKYRNLKTVGRLDRDSSGLLLLTDDGDFTFSMTHPKFHKTKTYEIELDKSLEPLHRQMISDHGIQLEDGLSRLHLDRLKEGDDNGWRVLMHEGRNRQIRRTFAAVGYQVVKLHRVQFGHYSLAGLQSGEIDTITP